MIPDCPDCDTEMDYAGLASRPSAYAMVYECPRCGETVAHEADESDMRGSRSHR